MSRLAAAAVITLTIALSASLSGCGEEGQTGQFAETAGPVGEEAYETGDAAADGDGLYYFIAVHCEPLHGRPDQEARLAENYRTLTEMVARADEYGIRLTLMFSPQWADYIAADPGRMAALERWRQNGHEIAAHHHSIYHGNWDGYTDYPPEVYEEERSEGTRDPEPYLGTLADYTEALRQIAPDIDSGCLNEEIDKAEMPDAFIYGTCAGYLNRGEPGTREGGAGGSAVDGLNEYVIAGEWDGIERRWLHHYPITRADNEAGAEEAMSGLESGVYGAVTHSVADQAEYFYEFLEFLHARDPEGEMSLTVTGAIEGDILPVERIEVEQFSGASRPPRRGPAGGQPGGTPPEGQRPPRPPARPR